MKTSQNGIDLIKQFEGCHLIAYKCPAGLWSIGYGHTTNVFSNMRITQGEAERFLQDDLTRFEEKVNKYSKYKWNQNEFDALVSFAYNIGNIDQLTANGSRDRIMITAKILEYNKVAGKTLEGLIRRRKAEQELFVRTVAKTVQDKPVTTSHGIVEYSLNRDGNVKISDNFTVKEFKCKDGSDKILIDVDFVRDKLQSIRNHFGVPVTINSAYRTSDYNKKVGGASKSYHMTGQAFDIVVKGKTPLEVARCVQNLCIHGIIQYNTFVHVDSRPVKYWARNDNGKVTIKNNF